MKILFVSHEEKLNGASLSLLGMIDELKKDNNNEIYVLTCFKVGPFINELYNREVKVIYVPYRKWLIYKPESAITWLIKKNVCLLLCSLNYLSALRLKRIIKKEK